MQRTTRALLVIVLALGLTAAGILIARGVDDSRAASPRPNFVIILTDDQNFSDFKVQKYTRSRNDWVEFKRAVNENPLCCPARASLLTGLYDFHTGVFDNTGVNFDPSSTIATWLDDEGYDTALIGKYMNKYPFEGEELVPPGWDSWTAFSGAEGALYFNYELYEGTERVHYGSDEEDYSTDVLAGKAEEFIRSAKEPFFLYFVPRAPHSPVVPAPRHEDAQVPRIELPPNFNEKDLSDKPQWMHDPKQFKRQKSKQKTRGRRRMMLAVDEAIERIFETLKDTGELADTYVIFMSDNGYLIGEHGLKGKSCGYEECIHTPLLIRGPDLRGHSVSAPVSNVDIAPTIAELAGIEPGLDVDGLSLVELLTGERKRLRDREGVLLHSKPLARGKPEWIGVTTRHFTLIRTNGTKELELYDLRKDPYQLENVAGLNRYAETVERLRKMMRKLRPPLERSNGE